jgi:hypothetical protein
MAEVILKNLNEGMVFLFSPRRPGGPTRRCVSQSNPVAGRVGIFSIMFPIVRPSADSILRIRIRLIASNQESGIRIRIRLNPFKSGEESG